jgi:cell division protein FtsQ
MKRGVVRFGLACAAVAVAALAGRHIPEALARVEVFRVRDVVVEGVHYLDPKEIRSAADIPDTASVWHELEPWGRRVEAHPMIVDASVRRRLPATLVVRVREREPVALAATPVLKPVDREGRLLPLDPARVRLDLPVVRVQPDPVAPDGPPPLMRLRSAARAAERLRVDPEFFAALSAVELDGRGDLVVRWGSAAQVSFRLALPVDPRRLREGLVVLADALKRYPDRSPREVDLRHADQVVLRF